MTTRDRVFVSVVFVASLLAMWLAHSFLVDGMRERELSEQFLDEAESKIVVLDARLDSVKNMCWQLAGECSALTYPDYANDQSNK